MIPPKRPIIQFCTKNCAVCFSPTAMFVGGHVHKDNLIVFAKLCHLHVTTNGMVCPDFPKGGCRGKWHEKMGLINAEGALVDPKKATRNY